MITDNQDTFCSKQSLNILYITVFLYYKAQIYIFYNGNHSPLKPHKKNI